jgi:hypothetical protein
MGSCHASRELAALTGSDKKGMRSEEGKSEFLTPHSSLLIDYGYYDIAISTRGSA